MTVKKGTLAKKAAAEKKRHAAHVAHLRAKIDCLNCEVELLAAAPTVAPMVADESEFQPPRHGPGVAATHHERAVLQNELDAALK